MSYLPTKIGWFRLPEYVQSVTDRVTTLEGSIAAEALQETLNAGDVATSVDTLSSVTLDLQDDGLSEFNFYNEKANGDYFGLDNAMNGLHWYLSLGSDYTEIRQQSGEITLEKGVAGGSTFIRITDPTASNNIQFPDLGGDVMIQGAVPASAGAAGRTGQVAVDANFFYYCSAPNTWTRAALATW